MIIMIIIIIMIMSLSFHCQNASHIHLIFPIIVISLIGKPCPIFHPCPPWPGREGSTQDREGFVWRPGMEKCTEAGHGEEGLSDNTCQSCHTEITHYTVIHHYIRHYITIICNMCLVCVFFLSVCFCRF